MALAMCKGKTDLFFPEREDGGVNHGSEAKEICRNCLVRTQCLIYAMVNGEEQGIWAGAGGDLLRWLRRAWRKRTGPPNPYSGVHDAWSKAAAQHFAQLDGEVLGRSEARSSTFTMCPRGCGHKVPPGVRVVDRNGPGAKCGKPVTYARGCRCQLCSYAAALRAKRAINR